MLAIVSGDGSLDLPAVASLERLGPIRFATRLNAAVARLCLPPGAAGTSAYGSATCCACMPRWPRTAAACPWAMDRRRSLVFAVDGAGLPSMPASRSAG